MRILTLAGSTQACSIQAGSTQAGSTQAGSTQAGSTQACSIQACSTQAGSTQAGSTQQGSTQQGSMQQGSMQQYSTPKDSTFSWRVLFFCWCMMLLSVRSANADGIWQTQPRLMLWAWEMPCDMRFIDKRSTGVAYLAGKIILYDERAIFRPRTQILKFKPGTYKMAVVRVELSHKGIAVLSKAQMAGVVRQVQNVALNSKIDAMQIDFDARKTERAFYKQFLTELKLALPPTMPLSITALSSWCLRDVWIKHLDCNEVVPMFFSMGRAQNEALDALTDGEKGLAKLPMQESLGLSVNDPGILKKFSKMTEHVYLFSPRGWNRGSAIKWVKSFEDGETGWKRLL